MRLCETPLRPPKSALCEDGRASVSLPHTRKQRRKNFRRLPWGAVDGYAPLSWDGNDPQTVDAAFKARLMRDVPVPEPGLLQRLDKFVDGFLARYVPAVVPLGFEEWLDSTNYDENRKMQLRQCFEELRGQRPSRRRSRRVSSFVKTESYPELKYPRMINSRSDLFKAYSGRFFKAIEQAVYELPWFIKHVPVPDRPALISQLSKAGLRYYESDYSAFESHFTQEIMSHLELKLYRWCLRNYPEDADFIASVIGGENHMVTRMGVSADVLARRMSGDMCTSLGNGFSNLMLSMFVVEELHGGTYRGFVEGDDGVMALSVPVFTEDYKRLGFTIKLLEHPSPLQCNFCGVCCSADLQVIKDPRRVFTNFGWTSSMIQAGPSIMSQLLRAKALSLVYEVPQCPIAGVLAREALRRTVGVAARFVSDGYHECPRDEMPIAPFEPSDATRELFAETFGVSVSDQLTIEALIRQDRMGDISCVLSPKAEMARYARDYVVET